MADLTGGNGVPDILPLPDPFRVRVAPPYAASADGGVVLAGEPLRLLRLTPAGRAALAALSAGAEVGGAGPGAGLLARRLVDADAAQPVPPPGLDLPVTVVVPVRDGASQLIRLLSPVSGDPTRALSADPGAESPSDHGPARARGGAPDGGRAGGRTPGGGWRSGLRIVVVDDGSVDRSGAVAVAAGAVVVRRDVAGGPAAARNAGAAAVDTELVAFVDADCEPGPGWLGALLPHFADPLVAAVAPRVRSTPGPGLLARYEQARSPLDLGANAGPVRPGTRLGYLPAAAVVVRRTAFDAVGGFDEGLRFGEDVDLVWRLLAAGWRVRYEPAGVVQHAPRKRLGPLLARRVGYGSAAAPLERRHPGALRPLPAALGVGHAAALVSGRPAIALALRTARLAGRLRGLEHPARVAVRVTARQAAATAAGAAEVLVRGWLPLALSRRPTRRLLLAAGVFRLVAGWRRERPAVALPAYAVLRTLDDAAYCLGVWIGCARERTVAPLVPGWR